METKVNEDTFAYIRQKVSEVEFGRVIIELNGTKDKVDVIVEHRKRFQKHPNRKEGPAPISEPPHHG